MHTIHYVLADVEGEFNESNEHYASVLEARFEQMGAGSWSDWWEVGGRWEGSAHEEIELKHYLTDTGAPGAKPIPLNTNIIPLVDYRQEVIPLLKKVAGWQNKELKGIQEMLTGKTIQPDEVQGYFGFPVKDPVESAQKMSMDNVKTASEWQRYLTEDLESLQNIDRFNTMAGYYARKLIKLVEGEWNPDSHFYDSIEDSTNVYGLIQWLKGDSTMYKEEHYGGGTPLAQLALIGVDFHY